MKEMTLKELLESLGYTSEQIDKILSGMKENEIYTSTEENIDERYTKLKNQHDDASKQLGDANKLIETLQEAAKGNEGLQTQIAEYQKQAEEANARAAKAERDSAIKLELLANGAVPEDIDYLIYRLESGKVEVKMGDNGKLSGMDDAVKALKTQFPKQFAAQEGKKIDANPLPKPSGDEGGAAPKSLAEALRAQYENPTQ